MEGNGTNYRTKPQILTKVCVLHFLRNLKNVELGNNMATCPSADLILQSKIAHCVKDFAN